MSNINDADGKIRDFILKKINRIKLISFLMILFLFLWSSISFSAFSFFCSAIILLPLLLILFYGMVTANNKINKYKQALNVLEHCPESIYCFLKRFNLIDCSLIKNINEDKNEEKESFSKNYNYESTIDADNIVYLKLKIK